MIRKATFVILTFGAVATALLTIPASLDSVSILSWLAAITTAVLFHGFMRRYWIAAALAACSANVVSHGYHLVSGAGITLTTVSVTMAQAFVIALAVGLPFSLRRAFSEPASRCHYCGKVLNERIWGVCPHCGELMDHA